MILVCGPCSAESYSQLEKTAKGLYHLNIDYFRAGLWKPRTRPSVFEGVGDEGLKWMQQIQNKFQFKICTEVASVYMVEKCLEYNFDAVWIGARTTQNPFLIEEIASALRGCNVTVMVKNPLNPDLQLWLGAIERFEKANINNIIAIHRGFSLSYNKYRQSPLWRIPIEFKNIRNDIPVICDPSHIAGKTEYVYEIANNAISTGFDGLMIETHYLPDTALTDKQQQLNISQLKKLIKNLPVINAMTKNINEIDILRQQITDIDENIVNLLSDRMMLSKEIAKIKKQNNIATFQPNRWNIVMQKVLNLANKKQIDEDFINEIYNIIHQQSIKEQNIIINKSS